MTTAVNSGFSLQPQFRELLIRAPAYKIAYSEITKQEPVASHPPSAAEAEGPWTSSLFILCAFMT